MKRIALITALILTAPAAKAEDGDSLMRKGIQLFLEGLQTELAPALDEFETLVEELGPGLKNMMAEMGPALADVLNGVEDWSVYEAPEVLPNGDIIIRRKPQEDLPKSEIEL